MKLKSLAAATIAASTLVMSAGVAHATSPEPSGWDDVLDVIKGGGSVVKERAPDAGGVRLPVFTG